MVRATKNKREPRKNGAPGMMNGALSDVKKLKSPVVKISGEKMLVRLVIEVNAPCTLPCSVRATVPATSPWMAGSATPDREPNTMMTRTTQPVEAIPYKRKAIIDMLKPKIIVECSPNLAMIDLISKPCTNAAITPTSAKVSPFVCSSHP